MIAGTLQVKSGYFYAVLSYKDDTGKRKQKWVATHLHVKGNKKKAEEILLKLRMSTAIPCNSPKTLFSDYMKSWLETIKSKVAPNTYASYRSAIINDVVPYFENFGASLNDIKPADIQKYYDHLSHNGLSNNTILHYHAYIRKALQAAFLRDLIPNNPADKVERPKKEVFIAKTYSVNELNQLLIAAKKTKIEIPIMLTVFYGLRRSEVLGLRWENIDFHNKTLLISHSASQANIDGSYKLYTTEKLKKKSSYRTLPLLENVEKVLLNQKAQRFSGEIPFGSYVCVDEKGELLKPCYLSKAFSQLLNKNNLRHIRYHDLRHSCANLLISSRVPLIEVQQWLGHSNISTTADLYSHLSYETKIRCGETIEKK